MSVLGRVLISSAQRADLPDILSIDSYTAGDFKYLLQSFVGSSTPYVLTGFDVIDPETVIGASSLSIRVADSIVYFPQSKAGPFFHGLAEGNALSQPLIPELKKNATNYVYLTLTTSDTSKDTRSFWDSEKEGGAGGEFTQDVNTESVLIATLGVSVSSFPTGTIPLIKVVVGAVSISRIDDCRPMFFRLGLGGTNPDPLKTYDFRSLPSSQYARNEPNYSMNNQLDPNPFQGGDKNIRSLKEWMDAVMTKLKELGGTTYWYQDSSAFKVSNIFSDTLATSIRSKGLWSHDSVTPGSLNWTQDIYIQSVIDKKDIIIRKPSSNLLLDNEQVLYINLYRDKTFNSNSIAVSWFNTNYINGSLTAFSNLRVGDWIKKIDDSNDKYVRVEGFYDDVNLGGSITGVATLAKSVKLSSVYQGTVETKAGIFARGIYSDSLSDLQIVDRDDPALTAAGGDLFWLALRSDTIEGIQTITPTTLNIDIIEANGNSVKVVSHDGTGSIGARTLAAHGLNDGERVGIYGASTVSFNDIWEVEVVDANTFYIKSNVTAIDQTANAIFATVTTKATRSDSNGSLGIDLEPAQHGFETDQFIELDNTTSVIYDGLHKIFVNSATTFTFPLSAAYSTVITNNGSATLAKIHVRTEFGQARLIQGETKYVGDVDTENLQQFVGMKAIDQVHPIYNIDTNIGTLNGQHNYNGLDTDNLTARTSKLTAMMADKAQDKTIKFAPSYDWVTNATNGANQDITFSNLGLGNYEVTDITFIAKALISDGQYFLLNSAGDTNEYYVYADVSGAAVDPAVSGKIGVRVDLSNILVVTADDVAEEYRLAIAALNSTNDFTVTRLNNILTVTNKTLGNTTDATNFNMPSGFAAAIQVQGSDQVGADILSIVQSSSPYNTQITLSGTLSLAIGKVAYFTINRNQTVTISDLTGLSIADISDVPLNENVFVFAYRLNSTNVWLWDQSELLVGRTLSIKNISAMLDEKAYDELIDVISGAPSTDNEIQGPILAGTSIALPLDSRDANTLQSYVVGAGMVQVFLNGQYLQLNDDWSEIGAPNALSSSIRVDIDLVVGDRLQIRIDSIGGFFGGTGGGSGEVNTGANAGVIGDGAAVFQGKYGTVLNFRRIKAGSGVTITEYSNYIEVSKSASSSTLNVITLTNTNHVLSPTEDVVIYSNGGTDRVIILPDATTNNGKQYVIKKIDAGNICQIQPVLGQTIDGASYYDISTQWESKTLVSNGVNWFIL